MVKTESAKAEPLPNSRWSCRTNERDDQALQNCKVRCVLPPATKPPHQTLLRDRPIEISCFYPVNVTDATPMTATSGVKRRRRVNEENMPLEGGFAIPKSFYEEDTPTTPRQRRTFQRTPLGKEQSEVTVGSARGFGIADTPITYVSDEENSFITELEHNDINAVPFTLSSTTKSPDRTRKPSFSVFGTPSKIQSTVEDDLNVKENQLQLSNLLHPGFHSAAAQESPIRSTDTTRILDETIGAADISISSDISVTHADDAITVLDVSSVDGTTACVYNAVLDMDPKTIFNWAFVCACNMNRSMSAHKEMLARGFDTKRLNSYGTSDAVRLPSRTGPAVFDFGVGYESMLHHVCGKAKYARNGDITSRKISAGDSHLDLQWTQEFGLHSMLKRNASIKHTPESWYSQNDMQAVKHDFVLCFDSAVYDDVLQDLRKRVQKLQEPGSGAADNEVLCARDIAVVLVHTSDNVIDAELSAKAIADFADAVCEVWKDYKNCRLTPKAATPHSGPLITELVSQAISTLKAYNPASVKFTTVSYSTRSA